MSATAVSKNIRFGMVCLILMVSSTAGSSAAQQFEVPILVTDGLNERTLVIGVHPDGTDDFDAALDKKAPPPPPAGAFDARLKMTGKEDLFDDIRANDLSEKVFTMTYVASSVSGGSVVVKWDTTGLSDKGSFQITDNVTGQLFGPLDMTSVDSINIGSQPLLSVGLRILVTPVITGLHDHLPHNSLPVNSYTLIGNFPNPFNGTTMISFSVAQNGWLDLDIYNHLGQKVRSIVAGNYTPGNYNVPWNGKMNQEYDAPTGVYYAVLSGIGSMQTIKMLYIK